MYLISLSLVFPVLILSVQEKAEWRCNLCVNL